MKWELRVEVGTSIAARPPHRSVRAALPHTALALDDGVRRTLEQASTKLPFSPRRLAHATQPLHTVSRLCGPARVGLRRILLSQQASLQPRVAPAGACQTCSVASSVLPRCPTPRRRACGPYGFRFRLRPPVCPSCGQTPTRSPGSRAGSFPACVGSATAPGPVQTRAGVCVGVAFRIRALRRRPKRVLSRLHTQPAGASVNASPAMSPPPAHDSKSGWFATPFL